MFLTSFVDSDGDKWNESSSYEMSDADDQHSKIMSLWVRIIWDSLFIGIIFVATLGNLMVLWIIAGTCFPTLQSTSEGGWFCMTFYKLI